MLDEPGAPAGLDCRPFKPGVEVDAIRELLDVAALWDDGFRGEGIVVGIIDEGIDGTTSTRWSAASRARARRRRGRRQITSHGSMCAADVLVAAPDAKLYDYPFLGIPNSGGALAMFQAVLDQRRVDGTPHLTSNSYGFVGVPSAGPVPDARDLGPRPPAPPQGARGRSPPAHRASSRPGTAARTARAASASRPASARDARSTRRTASSRSSRSPP